MRITDHALIRYLERVHGADFGTVRQEITDLIRASSVGGASESRETVKINIPRTGLQFVVKSSSVVTIVDKKDRDFVRQKASKQGLARQKRPMKEIS